jgi:hypothetical protein
MNIKDFAEKFTKAEEAAFQRGEFDVLEKLESPDVVYHLPPPLADITGFEGHKQYITGARQMYSEMRQEFKYLAGDGNVCVISVVETATTEAENPALSLPAGATIVVDALMALRLKNGKVAEVWIKGGITPKQ